VGFSPTAVTRHPAPRWSDTKRTSICALDTFRASASATAPTRFRARPRTVGGGSAPPAPGAGRSSAASSAVTTRGIAR
jgi:hypothetical protein